MWTRRLGIFQETRSRRLVSVAGIRLGATAEEALMNQRTNTFESLRSTAAGVNLSRRQLLFAGGVGLGALFVSGCTDSTAPAGESSAGSPTKGGTIRLAVTDAQTTDSLDPGLIISQNSAIVCNALYDP